MPPGIGQELLGSFTAFLSIHSCPSAPERWGQPRTGGAMRGLAWENTGAPLSLQFPLCPPAAAWVQTCS